VKNIAEEWEIYDDKEAKRLVSQKDLCLWKESK